MLKKSSAVGQANGLQERFVVERPRAVDKASRASEWKSPARTLGAGSLPENKSPLVAKARLVTGWRSASMNQDVAFASRQALDVSGWSSAYRLHRALRCCVFGESWADRLQREGDVVHGKVKVPQGYVTSMVEAFLRASGGG